MRVSNFEKGVQRILAADPRYSFDAYMFVQEALKHTQLALGRERTAPKHVGGKELLEGIRLYALKTFGPMVPTMFQEWGVHSCEDFGEIVFNMIEYNLATKSENDTQDDFKGAYDFYDAFRKPFLPSKTHRPRVKPRLAKVSADR